MIDSPEQSRISELEAALAQKSHEAGILEAQRHITACRLTALEFQYQAVCEKLFGSAEEPPAPRTELTPEETDRFTMGGTIPIQYAFNAPRLVPTNHPYIYTQREVAHYNSMLENGDYYFYGQTDNWLREAIKSHPVRGQSIAVFGSRTPWYETMCLHYGAHPTIIEYNPIISEHPDIEFMSVSEAQALESPQFDCGVSISSFEHDGLGRYGDPIDPDGDLKAMEMAARLIRPGGLLFLSVPVGSDRVVFNPHRVYGRKRLPLLLKGWEAIAKFGLRDEDMDGSGDIQPILVLRNRSTD